VFTFIIFPPSLKRTFLPKTQTLSPILWTKIEIELELEIEIELELEIEIELRA
jgi:hypothetical protein